MLCLVVFGDHEASQERHVHVPEWSFYLNRTTTSSTNGHRDPTLVFPPLGGQTAIGVAQSDH